MQNLPTNTQSVDEYISQYLPHVQILLQTMRETIKKVVPEADECICYGIPTYKLRGNLVHFGAFKNHIGFYPGAQAIKEFESEIIHYKNAKGSVQFPFSQPLPLKLITAITKYRKEQNLKKK